jgi:DNA polymerase-3 subunit beta
VRFLAETATLRTALTRAGYAVARTNPAIHALASVRLAAADGWLAATGSNLDVTVRASCPIDLAEPGAVLIDGPTLAGLCAHGDHITVADHQHAVQVAVGNVTASLPTGPLADWPTLTELAGPDLLHDRLADDVALAAEWASVDPTRPAMGSVIIEDGWIRATDSYRLLMIPCDAALAGSIPAAAAKIATRCGADWTVGAVDGVTTIRGDGWGVTARQIQAEPPTLSQVQRLVAADARPWIEVVDPAEFAAAMRVAAAASGQQSVVRLEGETGVVTAVSHGGTASVTVTVKGATAHRDGRVGVNGEYAARTAEIVGDQFTVRASSVLHPLSFDGPLGRVALVMPARIDGAVLA